MFQFQMNIKCAVESSGATGTDTEFLDAAFASFLDVGVCQKTQEICAAHVEKLLVINGDGTVHLAKTSMGRWEKESGDVADPSIMRSSDSDSGLKSVGTSGSGCHSWHNASTSWRNTAVIRQPLYCQLSMPGGSCGNGTCWLTLPKIWFLPSVVFVAS